MADPAIRLLRLLTLLQEHTTWTGPELAGRLDVSVRGVRRDIDRLRQLGYPVRSERGVGGGYQLAAGKAMPPLVLDDDEAVAVAVSLSAAAGGSVDGVGEASVRALAKLDQVVPARLRERIGAFTQATVRLDRPTSRVDAGLLTGLARACRDHVQVRVEYRKQGQVEPNERRLEPYRLVTAGPRWYLLAFDLDRDDWRVFRLDRMSDLHVTTFRYVVRDAPDAAERVRQGFDRDAHPWQARLRIDAPAAEVRDQVPATVRVEDLPDETGSCLLIVGADDLRHIVAWMSFLPWEMAVLDPPELRDEFRRLGERHARTAGA